MGSHNQIDVNQLLKARGSEASNDETGNTWAAELGNRSNRATINRSTADTILNASPLEIQNEDTLLAFQDGAVPSVPTDKSKPAPAKLSDADIALRRELLRQAGRNLDANYSKPAPTPNAAELQKILYPQGQVNPIRPGYPGMPGFPGMPGQNFNPYRPQVNPQPSQEQLLKDRQSKIKQHYTAAEVDTAVQLAKQHNLNLIVSIVRPQGNNTRIPGPLREDIQQQIEQSTGLRNTLSAVEQQQWGRAVFLDLEIGQGVQEVAHKLQLQLAKNQLPEMPLRILNRVPDSYKIEAPQVFVITPSGGKSGPRTGNISAADLTNLVNSK